MTLEAESATVPSDAARKMVRRKGQLFHNTLQTAASSFGVLMITMISSILLSRGLLPAGKGLLTGITLWSGLVLGVIDINLGKVALYQWGNASENQRTGILLELIVLALLTGGAAVAALEWIVPVAVGSYYSTQVLWMAHLYYLTVGTTPLTEVAAGILVAENKFGLQNLVRIAVPAIYTVIYAALWMLGKMDVAACLAVLGLVGLSGTLPYLWVLAKRVRGRLRIDWRFMRKGFWYGFKGHLGNVTNAIGGNAVQGIVFVGLSPAQLAYYNTAQSSAGIGWTIPNSIATTTFPRMVGQDVLSVHKQAVRVIRRSVAVTFLTSLVLSAAIPFLIPILYGTRYLPATIPAEILVFIGPMSNGVSLILGNALDSMGKTLQGSVVTVISYGIGLVGTLLTVHSFGLTGAVSSLVIGQVTGLLARAFWYYHAVTKFRVREFFPSSADFVDVLRQSLFVLTEVYQKLRKRDLKASGQS